MTPKWKQYWPDFSEALQKRLEDGNKTYGDASFERPIAELLVEMEEEAADIAGWGLLAWVKIREMSQKIETLETLVSGAGEKNGTPAP